MYTIHHSKPAVDYAIHLHLLTRSLFPTLPARLVLNTSGCTLHRPQKRYATHHHQTRLYESYKLIRNIADRQDIQRNLLGSAVYHSVRCLCVVVKDSTRNYRTVVCRMSFCSLSQDKNTTVTTVCK